MSATPFDARGALPSASRMTRIFNCPASFRLNAMETPSTNAAAAEGTMLHRVCELDISAGDRTEARNAELKRLYETLNDEQRDAVQFAVYTAEKSTDMLFVDGKKPLVLKEQRLWDKSKLYSGQADVIVVGDNKSAIIIDYKFGRGEVEPAERNYQLSALAVLVADNYDVELVRAMIIQPRALDKSRRITECFYDADDIELARAAIYAACKAAVDDDNPTAKCGYWCNYCPSAYRCNAAQAEFTAQHKLATSTPMLTIGSHNAYDMFARAKLVKSICDNVIAACKDFVASNPDAKCGLELEAGVRRAKLGNASAIFSAVESVGITPSEFVGVCDVGITKLTALYHDKRKLVNDAQTKKSSDIECKRLLEDAGLLTYNQDAPSLAIREDL